MQLTIFDVTKADRGNYTCTVYIDDGMPVNNTISLTVTKKGNYSLLLQCLILR